MGEQMVLLWEADVRVVEDTTPAAAVWEWLC